ncbi:Hypothetical protein CINCED_3A009499 [Cinara cedri]|uniref:Uncharacterized protein n=1 Tax=Cinara cedri TaxID=506608 RepID=A0A5E4NQS9_9HEMI|nr:Hypothetical protein CINCED_3A009499 [Cinara cedri]
MLSPATVRLLVFVFFYVLFLAIGAYVFSAIEAPAEAARVRELKVLRQGFLNEHKCVKDNCAHGAIESSSSSQSDTLYLLPEEGSLW